MAESVNNSIGDLQNRLNDWAQQFERLNSQDAPLTDTGKKQLEDKVNTDGRAIVETLKSFDHQALKDQLPTESKRQLAELAGLDSLKSDDSHRIFKQIFGKEDWKNLKNAAANETKKGTPLMTGPAMSSQALFTLRSLMNDVSSIEGTNKGKQPKITAADEKSRIKDIQFYGEFVERFSQFQDVEKMAAGYEKMAADFGKKAVGAPENRAANRAMQKDCLAIAKELRDNKFSIEMAAEELNSKGFKDVLAHCLSAGTAKTALNDNQKAYLNSQAPKSAQQNHPYYGLVARLGSSPLAGLFDSLLGANQPGINQSLRGLMGVANPPPEAIDNRTGLVKHTRDTQKAIDEFRKEDGTLQAKIENFKGTDFAGALQARKDALTKLEAKIQDPTLEPKDRAKTETAIEDLKQLVANLEGAEGKAIDVSKVGATRGLSTNEKYITEVLAHTHCHVTSLKPEHQSFIGKLIDGAGGLAAFNAKLSTYPVAVVDIAAALQRGGSDADLSALATSLGITLPDPKAKDVDPTKADTTKAGTTKADATPTGKTVQAKAADQAQTPAQIAAQMQKLCSDKGLKTESSKADTHAQKFSENLESLRDMRKGRINNAASVLEGTLSTHFAEFPELVDAQASLKANDVDAAVDSLDKAITKADADPKKNAGLVKDLKEMKEALSFVSDKTLGGLEEIAKGYEDLSSQYKKITSAYDKPEGAELRAALENEDAAGKIQSYFRDPKPAHLEGIGLSPEATALLKQHVAVDAQSAAMLQQVQGFASTTSVDLTNLMGRINAFQNGASFSPDQIKNYLANLANQGPSGRNLAGMLEKASFDKAKTRVASQMRYYEMMSLIESGMPIEMVVMFFMMMMHDDYDQRIRQKMEEVALKEQIDKHNEPVQTELDYQLKNGQMTAEEHREACDSKLIDPGRAGIPMQSATTLNQQLQRLMEELKQIMNMLSNIMRSIDEMAMTPIRNMR